MTNRARVLCKIRISFTWEGLECRLGQLRRGLNGLRCCIGRTLALIEHPFKFVWRELSGSTSPDYHQSTEHVLRLSSSLDEYEICFTPPTSCRRTGSQHSMSQSQKDRQMNLADKPQGLSGTCTYGVIHGTNNRHLMLEGKTSVESFNSRTSFHFGKPNPNSTT